MSTPRGLRRGGRKTSDNAGASKAPRSRQAREGSRKDDSTPAIRNSKNPRRRRKNSEDDSMLSGSTGAGRASRSSSPGKISRMFQFRKKISTGIKNFGARSKSASPDRNKRGRESDSDDGYSYNQQPIRSSDSVDISVEGDPPIPRGILKSAAMPSPKRSPRPKVQLINDPTHMPYHPGMDFTQNPIESDDLVPYDPDQVPLSMDDLGYVPASPNRSPRKLGNSSFDLGLQEETAPQNRSEYGQRARYSIYHGTVKRKFRVRPYHLFPVDFKMTEEEIYADSLKPSHDFIFLKSYMAPTSKSVKNLKVPLEVEQLYGSPFEDGRIGALRVEVLGCVSLARAKPDISVYLVCGDAAFCTDVLSGYRSPMWPSLSRRAAVFPLHHAFVQLYVGVFDVRIGKNKENDVFCGRVVLDVAALRADTEYDITFPLRASSFVYDRRKRGVIRLRFSVHWFSERAAILSYVKKTTSLASSSSFGGHPTIPCADPKTFRNVAVTVYGQDLPGKYSRNAFKSTVREFTLYQQNITLLFQLLVLDAVLYERVHISMYLFSCGMYCVITSSIRMIPPFCMGYFLLQYIENYIHYVDSSKYNLGYQPHTLGEIVNSLLCAPTGIGEHFEPHLVQKKTKRKRSDHYDDNSEVNENELEIEPLDHREFPFSERDAYPKFAVEDALAPSSSRGQKGTTRLHGRLSVYYTTAPPSAGEEGGATGDDDDSSEDSGDRDDETIIGDTDSMFNFDYDFDDLEEQEQEGIPFAYQSQPSLLQNSATARRIKPGPPQDVDIKGQKVPPQLQLQKAEKQLHKLSMKVAVEIVHAPAVAETIKILPTSPAAHSSGGEVSQDFIREQTAALKKRKAVYNEFDKLLGLQSRSANPLSRIMSSFLGPMMRMCRVFLYIFRISFHLVTWRDPYLSFWLLVLLSFITLVLVVFPWRAFFSIVITATLGPQNIFVRKYLEKKAREKAMELDDTEATEDQQKDTLQSQQDPFAAVGDMAEGGSRGGDDLKRFGWPFAATKDKRKGKLPGESDDGLRDSLTEANEATDRPPFQPKHHVNVSKKMQPRAVVIPYSRVKKDRFFDWPPDPTVSKATPMPFRAEKPAPSDERFPLSRANSREVISAPNSPQSKAGGDMPRGLRRRGNPPAIQSGLPKNLYL